MDLNPRRLAYQNNTNHLLLRVCNNIYPFTLSLSLLGNKYPFTLSLSLSFRGLSVPFHSLFRGGTRPQGGSKNKLTSFYSISLLGIYPFTLSLFSLSLSLLGGG